MTSDAPERRRASRALVWWGAGLLVVGLVAGAVGAAMLTVQVGHDLVRIFTATAKETPTTLVRKLDPGTYLVYERTSAFRGEFPSSVTVDQSDVTVTAPDGSPVPTEVPRWTETITRASSAYTGAVRFEAEQEGVYEVHVATPDTVVILAPGLGSTVTGSVGWIAVVGLSGLVFLLGIVLLLIGLLQARPMAVATTLTPAGWYADPQGSATWRWWDGKTWTDQVH